MGGDSTARNGTSNCYNGRREDDGKNGSAAAFQAIERTKTSRAPFPAIRLVYAEKPKKSGWQESGRREKKIAFHARFAKKEKSGWRAFRANQKSWQNLKNGQKHKYLILPKIKINKFRR